MVTHDLSQLVVRACMARIEAVRMREASRRLCAALLPWLAEAAPVTPKRAAASFCVRTDAAGIIRAIDAAGAGWLNVPDVRLIGKPLLYFVARGDVPLFRGMVKRLGSPGADGRALVYLRPRGEPPALMIAVVARVAKNTVEWTLRTISGGLGRRSSELKYLARLSFGYCRLGPGSLRVGCTGWPGGASTDDK